MVLIVRLYHQPLLVFKHSLSFNSSISFFILYELLEPAQRVVNIEPLNFATQSVDDDVVCDSGVPIDETWE